MASYEIESSSIWPDIKNIIYSPQKPVRFEYRAQLHTEKYDFNIFKVKSLDVVKDYVNQIGDVIEIKFKMGLGDYITRLYPFRTNLELSLKRITLQETSDKKLPNSKIDVVRYKAIFLTDKNPVTTASDVEQFDTFTLNNMDIVDVTLQLVDRSLEVLRIKTAQGIFRDVTQKKMITTLLAGESQKVLVDGKPSIDGINVIEPDNTDTIDHVVIPSGSNITAIPTYLHEKMGGVYSAGIGTYLQYYNNQHLWFVYPLFNIKRFDDTKDDKAIIYTIPQEKFPMLDRSYRKEGSIVRIVGNSGKKYKDSADLDSMNRGIGFRMTDARAYMAKPVQMTEDGPKAVRTQLNHESAIEDRSDGLNYAPMKRNASSNPFLEYSRINASQVARVDVVWENSDPSMIYPGMPCKYIYLDNNKPIELKGTIVYIATLTDLQGQGLSGTIYKNVTTLTLLVEQVSIEQKEKVRNFPSDIKVGVF